MFYVDFLVFFIVDVDMGFGGIMVIVKLVKMFVECGVVGIYMED